MEKGVAPLVLQVGNVREILQRGTGHLMNQPAVEGSLSLEQWEIQWQEFLRMLESSHLPLDLPRLPEKPSPWEDTKGFLASFEQVAEACGWPRDEWVIRLLPALSGEAAKAFNKVDARDKEDYGKVKAAILRRDTLNQEKQRQQFRRFCYHEAEGPRGAYKQLREMCRGWLRVENHSKEQILELLILEQLLSILPQEIQSWVRESCPESCSQVVALTEEFLVMQKKQVPLKEEAADQVSEMDEAPSESKQRHPFLDIKEEEAGEAGQQGSTEETAGELQRLSLENANKDRSGGIFWEQDDIRREERNDADEKRDNKPLPRQGGNFHEIPDQDERPANKERKEALCSNQIIYWKEKQNKRVACGKTFIQKTSFIPQEQICSLEKPYNCSGYEKSFSHQATLSSHQRLLSGDDQQNAEDEELHELTSKKAKNQELKRNFKNLDSTKIQEDSHVVEKTSQPYLCQVGDFFKVLHMGEQTYRCLDCGMGFSDKTQFSTHLQKHSGKKTAKCLECGKSYSCRSGLLRHQRIHTGEKPFECSGCEKKFSKSDALQRHLKTHKRKKAFECSECGQKFIQSGHLVQHLRIHRSENPFECLKCGKSFRWRSDFQRHQRTHRRKKGRAARSVTKAPFTFLTLPSTAQAIKMNKQNPNGEENCINAQSVERVTN